MYFLRFWSCEHYFGRILHWRETASLSGGRFILISSRAKQLSDLLIERFGCYTVQTRLLGRYSISHHASIGLAAPPNYVNQIILRSRRCRDRNYMNWISTQSKQVDNMKAGIDLRILLRWGIILSGIYVSWGKVCCVVMYTWTIKWKPWNLGKTIQKLKAMRPATLCLFPLDWGEILIDLKYGPII